MDLIQAIILGIVQGITEWLPISSSGHLALIQNYFGIHESLAFDILLHLGSLLVVLTVFYKDIIQLIKGVFTKDTKSLKMALFLIIATIPIAVVGFFLQDSIESIFSNNLLIAFAYIFTAIILYFTKYAKSKKVKLNFKNSFLIGFAQMFAILPGVSRSGITISTGLFFGLDKAEVAKFSFLLFIPAILGASLLGIKELVSVDFNSIIGMLFAIVSGFLSLKLLLRIIKTDKFHYFSVYCLFMAILLLML